MGLGSGRDAAAAVVHGDGSCTPVMVQERSSMLRVWNRHARHRHVFLTIFAPSYALRLGAVRCTRSGRSDLARCSSVHGGDSTFSFSLLICGCALSAQRARLVLSREAFSSTWVMLFAALFVLFRTMFPTLARQSPASG